MLRLEWNTWDEVCMLEFRIASEVFPPDSAVVRPAVNISDNVYNMEDGGHLAWYVCYTGLLVNAHEYVGYVDGDMYCSFVLARTLWCGKYKETE